MAHLVSKFDPFRTLKAADQAAIARCSQVVTLPANRRLKRRANRQTSVYLVRGEVCCMPGDQRVRASDPRARQPLFPEFSAVRTDSSVQVLFVDLDSCDFLLAPPVADVEPQNELWLDRFTQSTLMQPLGPVGWQSVLRSLTGLTFEAGITVVEQGCPGDEFYIIASGKLAVWQDGVRVASLGPGDFFGEDALISGLVRNATVVTEQPSDLRRLNRSGFARLVQAVGTTVVATQGARVLLNVSENPAAEGRWLPLERLRRVVTELPRDQAYAVTGGAFGRALLAVFVLRQLGFDAALLEESAAHSL
ncbi:MAG: cyclic nucleotide-binding domain-containing protein [Pseudomonadaceae bacterium]|nr:cyclic nucleotide-binding domain-containing protein [Pseudomonadaceae bacterium]